MHLKLLRVWTRVVYRYIPDVRWFYLLDICGKDEKDDLSSDEKSFLNELGNELRAEAIASVQRPEKSRKKGRRS